MCILNRTFAIKHMLSRGFSISLMEQYTDAAYNPARPPYVSHDEGTALTCSYIRKFYCPTVTLPPETFKKRSFARLYSEKLQDRDGL
jgi:hypothetical protein